MIHVEGIVLSKPDYLTPMIAFPHPAKVLSNGYHISPPVIKVEFLFLFLSNRFFMAGANVNVHNAE